MFIDITCSSCGEQSRVRAASDRDVSRCPRCGRTCERDSSADDAARWEDLAVDDAVIAWLVRSSGEPATEPADVNTCFSCGYEGSMPCDQVSGITICPACSVVTRGLPEKCQHVVVCPECRQPIGIHERDRGKTTVCPHCKYFLGCVLRSDRPSYGERRFLGVKLSHRAKAF